ncbi:hypothetical protein [Fusobacterium periodonticum]|uniref:Antitoxin VbhA domain-containing protein n=1 Tax=Fusobacterium periodonticum ATCC 33693 TaxID=546275 RepID=D4CRS2_9FUSO|nr:hypothetical protein [Fusobacterium periodonticum]EFE87971.1 hypothetical protein FUSPEROL_00080 [Fusobacterium periodonticum ATCC 33693]
MIDQRKLSKSIRRVVAVTEAECGKMSDKQIKLLIKKEKGEITTQDIIENLRKRYGVR